MQAIEEIIVVMRHGFRADKAGEKWSESETRPWDSPLSSKGWKEAAKNGDEICSFLREKPDWIFTSPYTRCLQTASSVAKACDVSFEKMIVDLGLSETYDYLHTILTVSSDDIVSRRGRYKNMMKWFFSKRYTESSFEWKLMPGLTLDQRIDRFVYDVWREPNRRRPKLQVCGKFPDYEMFANLGFNREMQINRYIRALGRCRKELREVSKRPRTGIIVTHGAGVKALHEHFLQTSPAEVDTAGYFVVCREGKRDFRLLSDRLDWKSAA